MSLPGKFRPGDATFQYGTPAQLLYGFSWKLLDNTKWEAQGGKVARALVSINALLLRPWIETLRPVQRKITVPLASIFRESSGSESVHSLATDILTDFASDDPNLIADLLMDSDQKAYPAFFPIAQQLVSKTVPLFEKEIANKPTFSWNDPPLDPSWTTPDSTLTGKIESAQGMLAERFAFCQRMPLDEFVGVAEALRPSGYRPTRFRPYAEAKNLWVASVWTRDGRPWRMAHYQSAYEIRQSDERNRKEGYLPVDVAGYLVVSEEEGRLTSQFAALWAQSDGPNDEARMVLAPSFDDLSKVHEQQKKSGLLPMTLHVWRQGDDKLSYSGVWHKAATGKTNTASFLNGLLEEDLKVPGVGDQQSGSLIDLDLTKAPPRPSKKEHATMDLQMAEATLKAYPDNLSARRSRAAAYFELGEYQKAIEDLDASISKSPKETVAFRAQLLDYLVRGIAHARLGHKDQAREDLDKFQEPDSPESEKLPQAVVVAVELEEGTDKALEALEAALKKDPQDSSLLYNAACAYALASEAVARKYQAKRQAYAERAIHLLRTAIQNGYAKYQRIQADANLDPLRELPAFAEIMKPGHLDRFYAAVWTGDVRFDASPLIGLDTTAHLQRCRELVAQGWRMVALSVALTSPERPPITASVWHRPAITEETKDRLAERQARAAVALLRMGKAGEVMPLLRHSADPRVKTFIINRLSPLGADPKILATELDRIDPNAKPTPAQGQRFMDAVLFHPETSQRRALILALGTYGMEGLSPGEREPLTGKLLDLYRNDSDSGIHGAAAWTLRQWKQREMLKELDAQLMKLKERGDRRWFVNSQGLTFSVIEGPVECRTCSPPTDTDRFSSNKIPHRLIIPRRFAIAATEISLRQFWKFRPDHGHELRSGPDDDEPVNNISWYLAAEYCNWLSRKEKLPECYEPNEHGEYAAGMKIKPDALSLGGYRLPTEAEWEYACRAGAETSRPYGTSLDLLGRYAWYNATSHGRAWLCASLQPNELGLFDMLGNVSEWCDYNDIHNQLLVVNERLCGVLGGTFDNPPADVRSTIYFRFQPSNRDVYSGFRPSRTYP